MDEWYFQIEYVLVKVKQIIPPAKTPQQSWSRISFVVTFCKYLKNISNFSSVHFEQFNLLKRKDKAYYFISTQDLTIGSVLFFSRLLWLKVCMYLVQSYKIDMSFFIKIMSCVLRLLIYIEKPICIPLSIFYYY